nr:thiolase family protein [Hyphomonas sp. Mor2]
MSHAYLIGGYSTKFGKHVERSFKDLVRETYEGVLADAGLPDGDAIEIAYFGTSMMHASGQANVQGQMCLSALVKDGRFPERVPVINVENACATSTTAIAGASKDIRCGDAHLALAMGIDKLIDPETGKGRFDLFGGALDQMDPHEWKEYYQAAGEEAGKPFIMSDDRTPFMDTYGMQAAWHMKAFGTTQRQLAIAAAKTHNFGADNVRAQYRFKMTPDEVLTDREVSYPLTRSMCAPMGDGAAAVLVCSEEFLTNLSSEVRDRAVKIRAMEFSGGKYRKLDEPGLTYVAAKKAFARSGLQPQDIDLAEVHDATSFSEIYQAEMMGFCDIGAGGRFVEEGHTQLGGRTPMNTSGGLISKGHPIGATGASMIVELMEQLRGEASARQVKDARLALAENGGGSIGFDEAVAAVTILERSM